VPGPVLTQVQQRVLVLMSAGSTATAAARSLGVHRNIVGNWLHSSVFRDALAKARRVQDVVWPAQAGSLAGSAPSTRP
jgi:hypothetical protein